MEGGEERETVFVGAAKGECDLETFLDSIVLREAFFGGKPEMTGGGMSRPSVAFLESCRAKSEACHHSRNLRANIEVGKRILRLERRRG